MPDNYITKIQGQEELHSGIYYEVDLSLPPIGEGGMGRVYKGFQVEQATGNKRPVAVKFLYEGLPASVLDRAIREASIKIKCENLVEMIAFVRVALPTPDGTVVEHYHVVSELLEGVMLHDLLNGKTTGPDGSPIAYAEELHDLYERDRNSFALEIVKKVLSGLMYLHDAGYVHRDIDPSNIMITADHQIKLIDFGVAHKMEGNSPGPLLTHVGSFLGKGEYAAPELVLGDVTHQNSTTDIYAVGILMFLLLTGKLPFTGSLQDVMQMQREQKMPVQEIGNAQLRKIVSKATQKKQADRYQSAAEFRVALDAITGTFSSPRTEPAPQAVQASPTAVISTEETSAKDAQAPTQIVEEKTAKVSAKTKDKKEKGTTDQKKTVSTNEQNKNFAKLATATTIIGLACGALLSYFLM